MVVRKIITGRGKGSVWETERRPRQMKEEIVTEGPAPYSMEFQFYCADDWETVT